MASIQEHLDKIKNAVFGKDVRQSIHDGLHEINQETESTSKKQEKLERTFNDLIINAGNSNAEVAAARNGFETLGKRLDGVDSQLDTNMKELNNIKNVFGGLKMTSPNGDTWYLCVDNYGQLGVIKEEYK